MCREQYGEYAYWCILMLGCKGFDIKTSLPSMNFSCSPIQWVKPWTKLTSIQSQKGTVIQSFFSSSKISIFVLIILSGGIFSFDASNSSYKNLFDHRHVERVWGASGDLWQGWWAKFHSLFGGDQFLLTVVGKRCNLHSHHFSNNFNVLLMNTFCNLPLSWTYHIWHRAK